MSIKLLTGDCRDVLKTLPDSSVHACVTSPPYYSLRSYLDASHPDKHRELGAEPTPEAYLAAMVGVFREIKRVLRPEGCCFVNLGDSYCSGTSDVRYVLREDCTLDELRSVSLAVFGVRLDGDETASEGAMCSVLSPGLSGGADSREPSPPRRGVESLLPAEPIGGDCEVWGKGATPKDRGADGLRRKVSMLWGDDTAVPDAGSYQRRRRGPSEEDGAVNSQDLPGGQARRLSEAQVSSAVLQLQLRDRYLRLLSARDFADAEVPASVRACFKAKSLAAKNLMMMPARLAIELQRDGWYLRSMLPWLKRSAMPESVTDRPASAVEYVFLLTRSARYFWDGEAVRQQATRGYAINPNANARSDRKAASSSMWRNAGDGREAVERGRDYRGETHDKESGRNMRNSDLFYDSLEDAPEPAARIVRAKTWAERKAGGEPLRRGDPGVTGRNPTPLGDIVARDPPEPLGLILDADGSPLALDVNPAAFSQAHFATFPAKLVEPLIRAGTSERGCCAACGAPWVRSISVEYENAGNGNNNMARKGGDFAEAMASRPYEVRKLRHATTTGWSPGCDHDAAVVPCTVLDPFAGAGTTLLVADRLQRDAIGIELNPDYGTMATERCVDDAPPLAWMEAQGGMAQ
jgi:hypothetical protein